MRVFATRDWVLKLVPSTPLRILDRGGETVPHSRLAWRTRLAGRFMPFAENGSVVVAGGMPTGAVGQLVVVDLSLLLTASDQMGHYACTFDVVLEMS